MAKIISSNEFAKEVENTKGVVVVDFLIDVDQSGNIAQKYRIAAVSTMIIFRDGVPVENLAGFMPGQNITHKVKMHS